MKRAFKNTSFILDSNVVIKGLARREPDASVLKSLITSGRLIFSPIVVAEFIVGADSKANLLLEKVLQSSKTVHITEKTAQIAAAYRREFWRKKTKVFLLDCFIAASCKQHNAVLTTNNTQDFPMKDIQVYSPAVLLELLI